MNTIVKCHKNFLSQRCKERGYELSEVMGCVIGQDGDTWTIDTTHPSYPSKNKIGGVGTELKKLLGRFGIRATSSCSCNTRARTMDKNGIEWCENNIDTIVGWLRQEANKRKLPFIDYAGKVLVKKAISNAKRINNG